MNKIISDIKEFTVVERYRPDFDRVCEEAYQRALVIFDVDDCGNINGVEGSERSCDSLEVEFVKYRHSGDMGGQTYTYYFKTWVEQYIEEEEEE